MKKKYLDLIRYASMMKRECGDFIAGEYSGERVVLDYDLIDSIRRISSLLSNPIRVAILSLLLQTKLPVCLMSSILNKDQTLISHHLSILRKSGIISSTRIGKFELYYVRDEIRKYIKKVFNDIINLDKNIVL